MVDSEVRDGTSPETWSLLGSDADMDSYGTPVTLAIDVGPTRPGDFIWASYVGRNSTPDTVADPFGESGWTLLAGWDLDSNEWFCVYYKIPTAWESGKYTFSANAAEGCSLIGARFRPRGGVLLWDEPLMAFVRYRNIPPVQYVPPGGLWVAMTGSSLDSDAAQPPKPYKMVKNTSGFGYGTSAQQSVFYIAPTEGFTAGGVRARIGGNDPEDTFHAYVGNFSVVMR